MPWILYMVAVAAGIFSTALSGSNATLAKGLGQPILSGLIVECVVVVVLLAIGLTYGGMQWPQTGQIAKLPWWAWVGGFGGASILLTQLTIAERIGAASYLGLTVTAGVVMSIAMDHFGWLGFARNPAHVDRLIGGALMIAGVALVARN